MKLVLPLSLLWILFGLSLFGCDEPSAHRAAAPSPAAQTASIAHQDAVAQPRAQEKSWAEKIRARADAAHAESRAAAEGEPKLGHSSIRHGYSRSESHIGVQPWPDDLPPDWPAFSEATVVADTRKHSGDRLLLLDWRGSPEQAMTTIAGMLEGRGFAIEQPALLRDRRALHVQRDEREAVVTFYPRDAATRVEILLIGSVTG